jgi:hypothetical protein
MRYLTALWIAAIGLFVGAAATSSDDRVPFKPVPREAREQAQRSLAGLRSIVTPETFQRLGFASVEEASDVQIEPPLPIFMVPLDRLREYRPNKNPVDLLVQTGQIRFPLSVGGQVRSSMVLREADGRWEVVRIGRAELTQRLLDEIHGQTPEKRARQRDDFFEASIPALSLDFLGRRENDRVFLTSLVDEPQYELQAGETLDARELFRRLTPFAQQLVTGPRIAN